MLSSVGRVVSICRSGAALKASLRAPLTCGAPLSCGAPPQAGSHISMAQPLSHASARASVSMGLAMAAATSPAHRCLLPPQNLATVGLRAGTQATLAHVRASNSRPHLRSTSAPPVASALARSGPALAPHHGLLLSSDFVPRSQFPSLCALACTSPSPRSSPSRSLSLSIRSCSAAPTGSPSAQSDPSTAPASDDSKLTGETSVSNNNGSAASGTNGAAAAKSGSSSSADAGATALPEGEPEYRPLEGWGSFATKWKMLVAPPWQRVKKGSTLVIRLSGTVAEQPVGSAFSTAVTLPKLVENLQKAAVDPRVAALVVKIDPLAVGWAKLQEIRRYIELFNQCGKPSIAYMSVVGEVEYYLASAFKEIYVPPTAYISMRGLAVQGQFLGGVLEKAGVEPQIKRIGKYKSAGDQLSRKDMSDANREMLTALLDDIYDTWVDSICKSRGVSVAAFEELVNSGVFKAEQLHAAGLVTALKYETEVEDLLKERLGQKKEDKEKEKPLLTVDFRRYSRVSPRTLGLGGSGDAVIAVLRASGAISRGRDRGMGGAVKSDSFIDKIRLVRDNKMFKAVVLRIDSPGGDALASDLMWHEIRELAKVKPVVASMSDVAASGGYYMAMAAPVIVAEELTLTGSIGVVLGKFNLGELYNRIGFAREIISRGKYAELNADNRPFSDEENAFYDESARLAYQSFRDKAAFSRSMEVETMEAVAQGRVWTGKAAFERGLVDALGGISRALAIAKQRAGIDDKKQVRVVELTPSVPSLSMLLANGAAIAGLEGPDAQRAALRELALSVMGMNSSTGAAGIGQSTSMAGLDLVSMMMASQPGAQIAVMPDIMVTGVGSQEAMGLTSAMLMSQQQGDLTVSASVRRLLQ